MAENNSPDRRPTPDPTVLTTEQLLREITSLKELMMAEIQGKKEVTDEKFESVNKQFRLIETQRVEQKQDTKAAVDAAFSAAKEAVKEQTSASAASITKSETSMLEQLKQMSATFSASIKATDDTVADAKERVSKIESAKQGGTEERRDARASISANTAIAAVVIALVFGLLAAYTATRRTPTVVVPTPAQTVTVKTP